MLKRILPLSMLIALLCLLGAGSAPSQAAPLPGDELAARPILADEGESKDEVATLIIDDAERLRGERLWSREARAAASPFVWEAPAEAETAELPAATTGPAGSARGGLPNPEAVSAARKGFVTAWRNPPMPALTDDEASIEAELSAAEGTPRIFTAYEGNYHTNTWTGYPWSAIGKLYFRTPNGATSYCTAAVINPRVIVTAAHCLYTRGSGWHGSFGFVPAERYGAMPFGAFGATQAWVMNTWFSEGGTRWDIGIIRLAPDNRGRDVSDYTGWLGRTWNRGTTQSVHTFGYAANRSSAYTSVCVAESYGGGSNANEMGCNMGFGADGGPWIIGYRPLRIGAMNYVNGVTSGGGAYPGASLRAPRFTSENFLPLCNVAGCS